MHILLTISWSVEDLCFVGRGTTVCYVEGNGTIPTCGKDCLSSLSMHSPFPSFSNNLSHTWSFSGHSLSRDHIYHSALQVNMAMKLNYPNGMWAKKCIYHCLCILSLKENCLAYHLSFSFSQGKNFQCGSGKTALTTTIRSTNTLGREARKRNANKKQANLPVEPLKAWQIRGTNISEDGVKYQKTDWKGIRRS